MKKISVLLCLALLMVMSVPTAYGAPQQDDVNIDEIYNHVTTLIQSGASDKEIEEYKNANGISTVNKEVVNIDKSGKSIRPSSITVMSTQPSSYTLTIWHDRNDRTLTTNYIFVSLDSDLYSSIESYPASYDVLSINWDKNVFTFVQTNTSASAWLADATKSMDGTVLFNFEDDDVFWSGVSVWATLSTKSGQRGVLTSSNTLFTHTYDSTQKNTSSTGNASVTWGQPVSLGYSYTVNTTSVEKNWTFADTTSFTTP